MGWSILVLAVFSLTPYLTQSTELVRLRNALLFAQASEQGFDWTPDTMPTDFMAERGPPDPVFVRAAIQLGIPSLLADRDKVDAISKHLLSNPHLVGTPIQSNLSNTYQRILSDGTGYCGDFTRVFMAFAIATGIPVRAWSFSFDGFGGHGHVLPEIWNRQRKQWQLVDIFNNYYFVARDDAPLSALEFRRAMARSPDALRLVPLVPGARPGYAIEAKAWDYYQRGRPEWYLSWGNNVFTYDRALLVRTLAWVSRSLEEMGGIAQGVYPRIHILSDPANQLQVAGLRQVRAHLLGVVGFGTFALLALAWGYCMRWLGYRRLSKERS